jgi:hypothetical protein
MKRYVRRFLAKNDPYMCALRPQILKEMNVCINVENTDNVIF